MDRITGAWQQLGRREQVLAGVALASLLVLIAFVLLSGGDDVTPIDASTTAADQNAGPVQPTPGMIVSTSVPPPASTTSPTTPKGMAPLAVSGEGELPDGPMDDVEGKRLEAEARKQWKGVPAKQGYVKPAVSGSVKATGRNLEAVAKAFTACVKQRPAYDKRGCVNVVKYGVSVENNLHDSGKGATFTARSSDGHKVELTIIDGRMCRALDGGNSCDAWTAD